MNEFPSDAELTRRRANADRLDQLLAQMNGITQSAAGRSLTKSQQSDFDACLAEWDKCGKDMGLTVDQVMENQLPDSQVPAKMAERLARALEDSRRPTREPCRPEVGGMWGGSRSYEEGTVRMLRREERMASAVSAYDYEPLSLGKIVRGQIIGEWKGAEAERRAMGEGVGSLGGFMVPESISAKVIDYARNKARCIEAGAVTLPMDQPEMTVVKITSDPTAYWRGEHGALTESDAGFAPIRLKAMVVGAICRVSLEMLEDVPTFTNTIENAMSAALALELDRCALVGTGAGEPRGLFNTPGVNEVDKGTNGATLMNYSDFSLAAQKVMEGNGTAGAVILAPRDYGVLDRLVSAVSGDAITPPASWQALKKLVTNQVPVNQTHGTATTASCAFVGDFSMMLLGIRNSLMMEVSRAGGSPDVFPRVEGLMRAFMRVDVAILRPAWFTKITGIIE